MYSPVIPEIKQSFPSYENPLSIKIFPKSFTLSINKIYLSPPKAVPYLNYQDKAPAFPAINSIIFPTVILDG